MMSKEEIQKRIEHLIKILPDLKFNVEKSASVLQNACKELLELQEKLNKLNEN